MTDTEYIEYISAIWNKRRVPKGLLAFVFRLLKTDKQVRDITHICRMTGDEDEHQSAEDFRALRDAKIDSPFSYPYFRVYSQTEAIHCKLLVPNLKAWDFKTGKKVIT